LAGKTTGKHKRAKGGWMDWNGVGRVVVFSFFLFGCRSTTRTLQIPERTFGGDVAEIERQFGERVREGMTTKELEEVGWSFIGPNVSVEAGFEIFPRGSADGDGIWKILADPEKLKHLSAGVREIYEYRRVTVHYRDVTERDRFYPLYVSKKSSHQSGPNMKFIFIFKGDVLIAKAPSTKPGEVKKLHRRLGEDLVRFFSFGFIAKKAID
jgi:hypothetical protein